jgi:hypothetical protein
LIRELKAAESTEGVMPNSAIADLVSAVGDQQVRDIVNDLKGGRSEPGWLPPTKARPEEKGSGEARHIPLEPPPGVQHIDRIAEHFAALDKRDLEKRLRGG